MPVVTTASQRSTTRENPQAVARARVEERRAGGARRTGDGPVADRLVLAAEEEDRPLEAAMQDAGQARGAFDPSCLAGQRRPPRVEPMGAGPSARLPGGLRERPVLPGEDQHGPQPSFFAGLGSPRTLSQSSCVGQAVGRLERVGPGTPSGERLSRLRS